MVEQIKTWREEIDALTILVDRLVVYENEELALGYNLAACKNTLLFAKAWMGKLLGELDVPSPYPKDGSRHTIDDIEKTADTGENIIDIFEKAVVGGKGKHWQEMNKIEKIDFLRENIKVYSNALVNLVTERKSREFAIARTNAYNYLCEARFYLGFELQRIKENG